MANSQPPIANRQQLTMRNFREYDIWQKAIIICKQVYHITSAFPDSEKYGLINQLRRASVSIPSNIAEGCSRSSEKEFIHFLEIAMGSSFELETQIILAIEMGFITEEMTNPFKENLQTLQKQLNSLRAKIKNKQPKAKGQ